MCVDAVYYTACWEKSQGEKMHAIIGSGRAAINHAYGMKENEEPILVCCDLSIEKAKAFAEKHGIPNYTDNYLEVLENSEITSVSVCTDHASHAKLTLEALEHNKHVIVEKPIALSLDDAQKMIDLAHKKSLVLAAVSQHRYDKLVREIKQLMDKKVFGEITMVNGFLQCSKDIPYYKESGWRGQLSKEGGSTLINQSIHTLDLIVHFLGVPTEIITKKENLKFKDVIETEDTLVSLFKFSNGAIGTFASTNTSVLTWKSWVEIVGTKGSIGFTTGFPVRLTTFKIDSPEADKIKEKLELIEAEREVLPPSQSYYGVSHKYQIKDFLKAIKTGDKLEMLPDEAKKTLGVVLRMYKGE